MAKVGALERQENESCFPKVIRRIILPGDRARLNRLSKQAEENLKEKLDELERLYPAVDGETLTTRSD